MRPFRTAMILSGAVLLSLGACSQEPSEQTTATPVDAGAAKADEAADEVAYASLMGNAETGEAAFAQCKVCHSMEEGKVGIGPSLHKLIGRAAGAVPGYSYSPAMKSSGIVWSEEKMFEFLARPLKVVPGTKMSFAGYPDAQKRADLIAWIKENGGG